MGIHFTAALQVLFERLAEPVHGLFAGRSAIPDDYEMLWECYASGQISDAELESEIQADPGFGQFLVSRKPVFH